MRGFSSSTGPGRSSASCGAAAELRLRERDNVAPVVDDAPVRRLDEAEDAPARRSLSAAALPRRAPSSRRWRTRNETPSTARTWPTTRCNNPFRIGKYFFRFLTSSKSESRNSFKGPPTFYVSRFTFYASHPIQKTTHTLPPFQGAQGGLAHIADPADAIGATRRSGSRPAGCRDAARAGDGVQRARGRLDAGDRTQQRARVGMLRVMEDLASTGPLSTTRPRYITTTRSHISATTPRSWVMSMIAMPARLEVAHQVEDLRLGGHVQRGGRLVGDEQAGMARERHGDHGALAHAAAELERIGVYATFRGGMPTRRRASMCPRVAPRPRPGCAGRSPR
jgi:hypothetical protein